MAGKRQRQRNLELEQFNRIECWNDFMGTRHGLSGDGLFEAAGLLSRLTGADVQAFYTQEISHSDDRLKSPSEVEAADLLAFMNADELSLDELLIGTITHKGVVFLVPELTSDGSVELRLFELSEVWSGRWRHLSINTPGVRSIQ